MLGRTRHASETHGSQDGTKQEIRLYKSETTWEVGVAGSSHGLDMYRDVECGASFPDPLKRWAGDDMNEASLAESTSAIDVASRMFGRNRPETTCMVMSCATLDD